MEAALNKINSELFLVKSFWTHTDYKDNILSFYQNDTPLFDVFIERDNSFSAYINVQLNNACFIANYVYGQLNGFLWMDVFVRDFKFRMSFLGYFLNGQLSRTASFKYKHYIEGVKYKAKCYFTSTQMMYIEKMGEVYEQVLLGDNYYSYREIALKILNGNREWPDLNTDLSSGKANIDVNIGNWIVGIVYKNGKINKILKL